MAAGEPLTLEEAAHLASCPDCATLVRRRDELAEVLTPSRPGPHGTGIVPPEPDAESGQRAGALLEAVEALAPAERMAILLRYGHELAVPEIADLLGVGTCTVGTLLVWGLESL